MAFKGEAPDANDPLLGFVPAPHVAPRRNSITAKRQREFIAVLAATGIVTQAARSIGASLEALYKLRNKPGAEGFAAAWDLAIDRGIARLEDCALARAIEGEERLVVSAGKVLGTERRHNESLVMFLLRQRRATRYAKEANIGPDHPLYRKVAAEYAEQKNREARDPAVTARIHKTLDGKLREWRMKLERKWEDQRRAWIAAHDGQMTRIDNFGQFDEEDDDASAPEGLPAGEE